MPLISLFVAASLYILTKPETNHCYTYQTEPLFLSFSDLAALEAEQTSQSGYDRVKTFAVSCHQDSVEVVITAYLLDPGRPVEPSRLSLGPAQHHCTAKTSGHGEYVIRAPLSACGSKVMFTHSAVLYDNLLLYSPLPASPGDVLRGGAAVPIQCQYGRRFPVSSGALKPTWSPPILVQSARLHLDFRLRLMTDDWSSQRKSSVYFLGEAVNIEASVDHHPPLRLYVDSCVVALAPDVNSYPRHPFIDHQGCFTDSQLQGSNSRFLPRVLDHLLQIQLEPFLFHQEHRHTIYITCYLEAEPVSNKEPVRRACSFMSGRWRSEDGEDHLCESCGGSFNSGHRRAPRNKRKHRQTELHVVHVTFLPGKRSENTNT